MTWKRVRVVCDINASVSVRVPQQLLLTSGDADIAHMLNSVIDSSSVSVPSLPFACAAWCPFPVSSILHTQTDKAPRARVSDTCVRHDY